MSVPVFIGSWIIIAWTGVALLGLLDPDVRLASRLGIKVENLLIYRQAFDDLVEKEKRGENTEWIGDKLPDPKEWSRYIQYVISEGTKRKKEAPFI